MLFGTLSTEPLSVGLFDALWVLVSLALVILSRLPTRYNMSSGGTLVTFGEIVVLEAQSIRQRRRCHLSPSSTGVITEVQQDPCSSTIQTDITNACNSGDECPVVHFQAGLYQYQCHVFR